jgi:predicted Zn-dependent protease with MMP-like domain
LLHQGIRFWQDLPERSRQRRHACRVIPDVLTSRSMDRAEFEDIVREALDDLPEEFARHLENVQVVIEDEPSSGLLRSLGMDPRRHTLFGLYQGVPLHVRGGTFGGALPDKISIFYRPLVHACGSPERIRQQVRKTMIHEVAHFFGLDDAAIRKLGY